MNCVVKCFGYSLETHTGPAAVQQATTAALAAASSESLNDVRNIFLFFFYPNRLCLRIVIVLVLIKLKVFFSANLFKLTLLILYVMPSRTVRYYILLRVLRKIYVLQLCQT